MWSALTPVSLGIDEADSQRQDIQVYKTSFETHFIAATEVYYRAESAAYVLTNSVPDYMKKAKDRLHEESNRINLYLHDSTKDIVSCFCFCGMCRPLT